MRFDDRPFLSGPSSVPTFVMITASLRLPERASQLPMIVSDSPPWLPSTHIEYESAVSIALKPWSKKASSSSNEPRSSTVQPKTLPPKTSGAIVRPDRPRGRLSMVRSLDDVVEAPIARRARRRMTAIETIVDCDEPMSIETSALDAAISPRAARPTRGKEHDRARHHTQAAQSRGLRRRQGA